MFFLLLLIVSFAGFAGDIYLRLYTGYDLEGHCTWRDKDCSDTRDTPVYGCGYYARGDAGKSSVFDFFAGYRADDWICLELGFLYRPGIRYEGQVNYPDAGDNQPVRCDIKVLAGTFNVRFDLLSEPRWFRPYVVLGAGISRNSTDDVYMTFPELERPHNFIVPGDSRYSFCCSAVLGNSFRINDSIAVEMEFHYTDFGVMETARGEGRMEREGQVTLITVNPTEASLFTYGARIGISYKF